MHQKGNKNGAVVWTNGIISFILSGLAKGSTNTKTGGMIQSYILRDDMKPTDAVKRGKDAAICGNCPFRGDGTGKARGCYVNLATGPTAVYNGKENYCGDEGAVEGRALRLGSYGDPCFVPLSVLRRLVKLAKRHTGYTHGWRKKTAKPYAKYLMASVESLAGKVKANAMGWRTFRVTSDLSTKTEDEIVCPASEEMGKKVTCEQCSLCNGNWTGRKKNVVILAHGSPVMQKPTAMKLAE